MCRILFACLMSCLTCSWALSDEHPLASGGSQDDHKPSQQIPNVPAVPQQNLPQIAGQAFALPIIHQIEGWTVKIDPQALSPANAIEGERALQALTNHLQRAVFILPEGVLQQLRTISIWVEWKGRGEGLVYHPSADWLANNGFNPAMAKHVHVPDVDHLLDRRQWAKHPYAILHELAHAYHDQVLGWDHVEIRSLYDAAKKSGAYDHVLDHAHHHVRHYAMNNHKEYFAESTEAYLGVNDFYPFVRAELKQHDPRMFQLMTQIWGQLP